MDPEIISAVLDHSVRTGSREIGLTAISRYGIVPTYRDARTAMTIINAMADRQVPVQIKITRCCENHCQIRIRF